MTIEAIKAKLYDLVSHPCNGRLTVSDDGSRDTKDHPCTGCTRIGELQGQLREAEAEEETGKEEPMSANQNAKPELCAACSQRVDDWATDRIRRLAAQISNGWELSNSWLQNSESELMICQTLSAAVINLEKRGEPYSIRKNSVFSVGQCVNNGSAYRRLLSEGYFTEQQRDIDGNATTVIFMTPKLLDAVEEHFAKPERR